MPAAVTQLSIPDAEEAHIRDLRCVLQAGGARLVGPGGRDVSVPPAVRDLFLMILDRLQAGHAISIVSEQQDLTTQRAADILGVSRPFLVGLVEAGAIPFHMVGRHRRVYLRDLLEYKQRRDVARHDAIANMAKSEMEAGTYDTVVLPDGAEDE
jgi:excisionase family DNA binding protein